MGIEQQFEELFSEQVTLLPKVSVDKYGKQSHAASAVPVAAHLVAETKLSYSPDGREVVETGRIYLYGYFPNVDTDFAIVLADGSRPVIIGVDTPHDQNGGHHTVIRVGKSGS